MLQEFRDIFPDEIPVLPPKRDIDFVDPSVSETCVEPGVSNTGFDPITSSIVKSMSLFG